MKSAVVFWQRHSGWGHIGNQRLKSIAHTQMPGPAWLRESFLKVVIPVKEISDPCLQVHSGVNRHRQSQICRGEFRGRNHRADIVVGNGPALVSDCCQQQRLMRQVHVCDADEFVFRRTGGLYPKHIGRAGNSPM
jgi:hypothetical protein